MTSRPPLPVDRILPELLASLESHPCLVLEAAPGAGKTTRVPAALIERFRGEVIVLEPRRIAARMAAHRVAFELGEEIGGMVGYQVRFEERTSTRTRLRFITEGILPRRLLSDPDLAGVDVVVLDEFHERHVESDLALALLKRLQSRRPDLRLVVMSATLNAAPIARYLNDCPILRAPGRSYPLSIRHLPYSPQTVEEQVRAAVELLEREGLAGNILAFLPGSAEIARSARACAAIAQRSGLVVRPLHGGLPVTEQDEAVRPSVGRRLILATNVAESSVTVEGVTAVIDSGLCRRAAYSSWTGLPTLEISRISKASAMQRAGRAGRTGPGQVLRLYPEEDFRQRPEQDSPEIERADLAQLLLSLRAMKLEQPGELDWLNPPPEEAVQVAEALLDQLGAHGLLTAELARLPLHPRLARIVVEAMRRGVGRDGCRVAALLSAGVRSEKNDLLALLESPLERPVEDQMRQLLRITGAAPNAHHDDDDLLLAVLHGFPDRVARRRAGGSLLLSNALAADLAGSQAQSEFLVALDVEDRREKARPLVRVIARVEPEWLLEYFPDKVSEKIEIGWNRALDRVERTCSLRYDQLILEETSGNAPQEQAAALLASHVLEAGIERFVEKESYELLLERIRFAELNSPNIALSVGELCAGLHSFADFRAVSSQLLPMLERQVDAQRLAALAPVSIRLPGGRQTRVHYEAGRPPWIASRLQDFFGMQTGPCIGPHQTALVVHLLAPNQRAVQTTTDLEGFWKRLYPQVRRELMRRYPRHAWPEDPAKPA